MDTLCLLLVVAFSQAVYTDQDWETFKISHHKRYLDAEEEQKRLKIFSENKNIIENHNKKYRQGLESFSMAMNRFGDMSQEEFSRSMRGLPRTRVLKRRGHIVTGDALPDAVDWRAQGAVTAVKDQGQCGACWAFSAAGSLEGQHFLNSGQLVSLSEQQLIDCSGSFGNKGCSGGNINQAFIYIFNNGGIDTEDSYPFEGKIGDCRYKQAEVGATLKGVIAVPTGDEGALQSAVAAGPVSAAIDATLQTFQFYSSGIYYDGGCSPSTLSHGVVVVGYGSEDSKDYWLVKNSWGTSWGEAGYIKMSRNRTNNCGIATSASYPKV